MADLGSDDYRDPRAGAIDFSRAPRSPGSTLKPFIYAQALERGIIRPTDVLADLPEGSSGVNNADGSFLGPMLPRQALANSRNVPATNLLRSIGLDTAFRFLHTLGLHDIEVPADSFGLSMAIGSLPTTLEKLVMAYGALAEDGRLGDLVWFDGQKRREPVRVLSADSSRLITSFLADPMARLPSFARYGALEYPFPVAVKTGTSQGYRDAWTVAWSRRYLVGVWTGRGDDGTMNQLSGAGTAGRLVHAIMLQLHGAHPGDLEDAAFPPRLRGGCRWSCAYSAAGAATAIAGRRLPNGCGRMRFRRLTKRRRAHCPRHPTHASGLDDACCTSGLGDGGRLSRSPITRTGTGESDVRLSISTPENNSHIWLNPDAPAAVSDIALKVVVEPRVPQVVWYVDGEPFAVADPDKPVFWPATPGEHRFQARLPLRRGASPLVHIVVD